MFNKAATDAFAKGFRIGASFDLTACYDSIDHKVLRHFLRDLGVEQEFCDAFLGWLSTWTATDRNIFHGHGIPQGPLSSGLVSETVLRHFDDHAEFKGKVQYLRYVDDIRLFARKEKELRRALIRLDQLSKDIGLFPQSGKISIHEISDITEELKSISQPSERAVDSVPVDQRKIRARILELSRRYEVKNTTRFKYVLAHAIPAATITQRLWRIYERRPEYYEALSRYLTRYSRLPRVASHRLVKEIVTQDLYQAISASFLRVARGKLHQAVVRHAKRVFKPLWKPRISNPEFTAALGRWLIAERHFTDPQLEYALRRTRTWWCRAQLFLELSPTLWPLSVLQRLVNSGIRDSVSDVAVCAAQLAGRHSIEVERPYRGINRGARRVLQEFGLIRRAAGQACGIALSFERILGVATEVNWRKMFRPHYQYAERQIIESRGYLETNASAWINSLDVFNDYLVAAIFSRDGSIGSYKLGQLGSVLSSTTSRFANKYPQTFNYVKEVHETRYKSSLSHPLVRTTGKATGRIPFYLVKRSKTWMRRAVREIAAQFSA